MRLKSVYHGMGKSNFIQFVTFSVFLLFFYLPIVNLLMLSFSNQYEYPDIFPSQFGIKWWDFVFSQNTLVASISSSFSLAILSTVVSLLVCIPASYALARFDFKGKGLFMFTFLLSNAFPKMGIYISIGVIFYKFNLMGTLPGVIIIHVLNTMMYMVMMPVSSFQNVHRQQEEAARDAGAGPFRTFAMITLPMAMPGIIVATLFTFLGSLQEDQGTLIIGFPQIKTITTQLYGIIMEYPTTAGPVLSVILIIPTIIIIIGMRRLMKKTNQNFLP